MAFFTVKQLLIFETSGLSQKISGRKTLRDGRARLSGGCEKHLRQYVGLNSAVSALIVSHNSGKSGSRVPASSCAAGTFLSDITFDPMIRNARRMCVYRHFRNASS